MPPETGRVFIIRVLAAILPVVVVCLMIVATRWSTRVPSGEIVQLTYGRSFEGRPSLSPDGEWVAYRGDAGGTGDIFLRSIDGRQTLNLTAGSADDESDPAFSPDGASIAFARSGYGIAIVDRSGSEVRRVTREGVNPAWTPDGRVIVYAKDSASQFRTGVRSGISQGWKVDVATGVTRQVSPGDFHDPSVSPNGRRIAYWGRPFDRFRRRIIGTRGQIWTVGVDGTNPVRVTRDVATESNPIWSRDGRFLYFISNRGGSTAIWSVRIDERTGATRSLPVRVPTPGSQPVHITLSADGRRLAWSDARPIQRAMRIGFDQDARRARGTATEILTGDVNWEGVEPSPDGSMLALASSQGYLHIARVESPNTPARKLTDDEMLDRHARWSPDGEWIAIQSYRDGVHGVWLVRPDTGAVRVVPRSVGALQNPVWSPDGDQLAVWDSGVGGTRIVRLAGEAAPSETLPSLSQGGFVPGDWSPDGRLIAGTISGAIWIYSVEGRSYEQFRPGAHPVWLQDSRRIIYSYGGRLYMADTALGISRELLSLPDQQLDAPRLSRDNLHLYFTGSGEDANLWMMTLHGR